MKQFHPLTIERIENETSDSVRIALAVPAGYESDYEFLAGQHLPFEITIDGRKLRRTYSICCPLAIRSTPCPRPAIFTSSPKRVTRGTTSGSPPAAALRQYFP
jgi:hypothetical protein